MSSLNLLPDSVTNRRVALRHFIVWAVVWTVTGIGVFSLSTEEHRRLADLESRSVRLEVLTAPVKLTRTQLVGLQVRIQDIEERESWLVDSDSQQTLQLIGIISGAAAQVQGRVSVDTLNLAEFDREIPVSGNSTDEPTIEHRMKLNLNGLAVDDLAVASFVAGLRDTGVFESVELHSSISEIVEQHSSRRYDVSCVY